jgi:hypothetical protein
VVVSTLLHAPVYLPQNKKNPNSVVVNLIQTVKYNRGKVTRSLIACNVVHSDVVDVF